MSPRPPPKISLRHDWTKEKGEVLLGSEVGKFLDKQNSSNQPNQSQNQSVIDQGNLITNTKCLLIKKLPYSENFRISSWSYGMEGHAKKCVERYCELANKTTQQLYKVSTPCIDDHHFKEKELKSVGEFSQVCSQIVFEMLKLGTYWKT